MKEIKEIKEPSLVGAMSLKGKKVKLKYIYPNSCARILIAEFDLIWVKMPRPFTLKFTDYQRNIFEWEVLRGDIYKNQLSAIPESAMGHGNMLIRFYKEQLTALEIAYSNMLIQFTLEFTLDGIEYEHDDLVKTEPIEIGIGACSSLENAFAFSELPNDKVISLPFWEGQGEWLWRLDGKKWG
jgi:hypothetical protein